MADTENAVYVARSRGSTEGAVTGRRHQWDTGDEIRAPAGEFGHVSDDIMVRKGNYQTRPMRPETETETESEPDVQYDSEFEIGEQKSPGFYYIERAGDICTDPDGRRIYLGRGKADVEEKLTEIDTLDDLLAIAHVED